MLFVAIAMDLTSRGSTWTRLTAKASPFESSNPIPYPLPKTPPFVKQMLLIDHLLAVQKASYDFSCRKVNNFSYLFGNGVDGLSSWTWCTILFNGSKHYTYVNVGGPWIAIDSKLISWWKLASTYNSERKNSIQCIETRE